MHTPDIYDLESIIATKMGWAVTLEWLEIMLIGQVSSRCGEF